MASGTHRFTSTPAVNVVQSAASGHRPHLQASAGQHHVSYGMSHVIHNVTHNVTHNVMPYVIAYSLSHVIDHVTGSSLGGVSGGVKVSVAVRWRLHALLHRQARLRSNLMTCAPVGGVVSLATYGFACRAGSYLPWVQASPASWWMTRGVAGRPHRCRLNGAAHEVARSLSYKSRHYESSMSKRVTLSAVTGRRRSMLNNCVPHLKVCCVVNCASGEKPSDIARQWLGVERSGRPSVVGYDAHRASPCSGSSCRTGVSGRSQTGTFTGGIRSDSVRVVFSFGSNTVCCALGHSAAHGQSNDKARSGQGPSNSSDMHKPSDVNLS